MPMRALRSLRSVLILVSLTLAAISTSHAQAPQSPPLPVVRPGDAVVTGFAGTVQPGPDLPADIHPLDRTNINPDGVTARVFDLSRLGGGPEGQLSDAPVRITLKARDIGHVFGAAFDGDGSNGPPNVYLAASSVHGLQLMAPGPDGRPQRVLTGRPGAEWMTGLFGTAIGGSPGSIYKIDGRTGAVTLFADIKSGDLENSGAGLGALAYDSRSRTLFASDLETGLVWRLDMTGRILDSYDHGSEGRLAAGLGIVAYDPQSRTDRTEETFNTEVPETWGFAPLERRVFGLAIENNRLYYATADGPAVWSVGLKADGSFAGDARLEINVEGTPAGSQISTILFDGPRVMYLAQRGNLAGSYDYQTFMRPQEAAAMRYQWNDVENRWQPAPQEYAVGLGPEHHAAVGGLALNYGYDRFGQIDPGRCRQTLWLTGEQLRAGSDVQRVSRGGPRLVSGLQGVYKSRVKPENEPPFESWFVDYDQTFAEEEAYGHIGNVAIYGPCQGGVTYAAERIEIPVWTRGANFVVEKICEPALFGAPVRCRITVKNSGDAVADGIIKILDETRILFGPAKGKLIASAVSGSGGIDWGCSLTSSGALACGLSAALVAPGVALTLDVTVETAELVLTGNSGFRNCVSIDHPAGKSKACAEGGAGLTVHKSGPAVCEPGDDCTFKLTLTNATPLPFKGPVLIADHMLIDGKPVDAPISKIVPPLACKDEPVGVPFSCVAEVALAPGESLVHNITIEMPGPGPKLAQNCFVAADPWIAGQPDALAGLFAPLKLKGLAGAGLGGHPACVWIKLDHPDKVQVKQFKTPPLAGSFSPTGIGFLPPIALCGNGLPPLPGGRCGCPLNAPWDPVSGTCRWRPQCWDSARLTPDGDCCPRGTVWWASSGACRVPPVVGCTDPWRRRPDGGCCPIGLRWRDGACRPRVVLEPCGFGFRRHPSGVCIALPVIPPVVVLPRCPDGRPRLLNGRCPTVTCPLNAPFNPVTGRCQPYAGPACPPGQTKLTRGGPCVPVERGCPGRLVRDGSGKCVPPGLPGGVKEDTPCLPGQRRISGRCVGPSTGPSGPGLPPRGPVACPGRLVPDGSGKCVPPGLIGGGAVTPPRQPPPRPGTPPFLPPPKQIDPRPGTTPPPIQVPPRGGQVPPIVKQPPSPPPRIPPKSEPPKTEPPKRVVPKRDVPKREVPRVAPRPSTPKPPPRSTPSKSSTPKQIQKQPVKRFVPPPPPRRPGPGPR